MIFSNRNEKRNFILKRIVAYHEHPALWDIKSDEYINRTKNNHACDVLLKKY